MSTSQMAISQMPIAVSRIVLLVGALGMLSVANVAQGQFTPAPPSKSPVTVAQQPSTVPTPGGEVATASKTPGRIVKIFDGKTLDQWKGDPVYWRVEDGCLVGEVTPDTLLDRNTFIIWQGGQPADFELKLEYRISSRGNSGINYRSLVMDDHPYALTGYQGDIDGRNQYTGQNYEERGRTTLAYRGQKTILPPLEAPFGPAGLRQFIDSNAWTKAIVEEEIGDRDELATHVHNEDWNAYRIVARGNHLQHFVNGVLMSDVTDNDEAHRRSSGYIGVQVHVGPPMKVEYRNIMLHDLN